MRFILLVLVVCFYKKFLFCPTDFLQLVFFFFSDRHVYIHWKGVIEEQQSADGAAVVHCMKGVRILDDRRMKGPVKTEFACCMVWKKQLPSKSFAKLHFLTSSGP